jgi:hypothetical protein
LHEAFELRPDRAASAIAAFGFVVLAAGLTAGAVDGPRLGRTDLHALVACAAFVASTLVSISGRRTTVSPAPTAPIGDR